ncbi:MAG: hypothetical protein VX899_10580 [Myxococcota bacterium]|nr:hypothetical protein [Myxococcota bacterium]
MDTERGLRLALTASLPALGLAAIVELALAGHTQDPVQWLPFVLAGAGVLTGAWLLAAPSRIGVHITRGTMVLLALGGLFGIWEHLEHNLNFQREIRPNAELAELLSEAIQGGSPLLAPGMFLALTALGWMATWRHPALSPTSEDTSAPGD